MRWPSTSRARACGVTGFAGLPTLHRPDPGQQYLFVNGRPVKDKLLIGAVRAAYGDLLPKGRYPLLALFVALSPREVDVNVHPSKAEVRFRDRGRRAQPGGRRAAGSAGGGRPPASTAGRRCRRSARWRARRASAGRRDSNHGGSAVLAAERHARAASREAPGLAGAARRAGCTQRRAARRRPSRPRPNCSTARSVRPARSCTRPTSWRRRATRSSSSTSTPRTSGWSTSASRRAMANGGVARQVLLIPEIVEARRRRGGGAGRAQPSALARLGLVLEAVRGRRGDGARGAGPARRHRRQGPGARPGARGGRAKARAACSRSGWRRCARPWPATAACAPGAA